LLTPPAASAPAASVPMPQNCRRSIMFGSPSFTGKNRNQFFRYRASFAAAKSVVFAACAGA